MNVSGGHRPEDVYVLHGLKLSYFTGKLEAYFRAKGIAYRFVEMDTADFRACARATGIKQMPQLETPAGSWLTDTTAIIAHFEALETGPKFQPADPAAAFCSLLLEDLFDEWFWRPALYYRWAFKQDQTLMSAQIASTFLRDVPLPHFLRRCFILARQRRAFLKNDGVTKTTAPQIEGLYLESMAELERIFKVRPFLFGDRPCEADFGLFGPCFRHFFSDPTPALLMRERAPHVAHWVTRLWLTNPADLAGSAAITTIPADLGYFFDMVARDYLPYLQANSQAYQHGDRNVCYQSRGVDWCVPIAPYRVHCNNTLKAHFSGLGEGAKATVSDLLGAAGVKLLSMPAQALKENPASMAPRDRLWRR